MRYALVENDSAVLRYQEFPENGAPELPGKPQWNWRPVVTEPAPEYDPLRQSLAPVTDVGETEVTEGWEIATLDAAARSASVDAELARLLEASLGPVTHRLKRVTEGVLLLDAHARGDVEIDAPEFDSLREIGAWWQAMEAHAGALRDAIAQGGNPEIGGWPVLV